MMTEREVGKHLMEAGELLTELGEGVNLNVMTLNDLMMRVHSVVLHLVEATVSEGQRKEEQRKTASESLKAVAVLTEDLALALQMLAERHALKQYAERQKAAGRSERTHLHIPPPA